MPIGTLTPYLHGKKKKRLDYIFTDGQGRFVVSATRNGKRKRKVCENLSQAQYWAKNVNLLFPQKKPKPTRLTVAQLIDRYPPTQNKVNAQRSDRYLKKALGGELITELNRQVAKRYLEDRVKQPAQYAVTRWVEGKKVVTYKDKKPARQVGPKTANDDIRRLHALLEQARDEQIIDRNPIRKWKPLKEPPHRTRWLLEEEEERLKEVCDPEFWRLIQIGFLSGMRQGEQFGCRRRHILWEANSIYVPKTKTHEARHIPMSDTLCSVIKRQLEILDAKGNPTDWLCINESRTNRISQKTLYAKFDRAIAAAGIEDFNWHDLRHTFCSRLALAGESLKTIKELAGHARIETTERYAHLTARHLHEAVKSQDRNDTQQ